jgi:hypothetical protein
MLSGHPRYWLEDLLTWAAEQAAVATSTDHFAALNDANQEIYFTCTPSELLRQIEIPPSGWAETLPFFSVIEVRKRSKRDSSTRVVREQAGLADSGPLQTPPPPPDRLQTARASHLVCYFILLDWFGLFRLGCSFIFFGRSPPRPIEP